ncbi:MAG: redoxin domain-containing protein [Solirubrobacteraceae bacterium]
MRRHVSLRRALIALVLLAVVAVLVVGLQPRPASAPLSALTQNPDLDPGTSLSGPAPDFTLTDQFGRPVSLDSYRGRVVLLAFTDSQCTTICPLTTTEMLDAKRLFAAAGTHVALLGVDANPDARSVQDVRAYSQAHQMSGAWRFLTGSLTRLRRVWSAYHISVQIEAGEIDHTPALYVIDPQGHLAKLYLTEMAYTGIQQQAQVLAREISSLLPGHPAVRSQLSYARIPAINPATETTVPEAGGGTLTLGEGHSPRLFLFFATWNAQTSDLAAHLQALASYTAHAKTKRLAALTAIDEASVEPSPNALTGFLERLGHPLAYPVGLDETGRLADGYDVEDEPWLVLISASGQILWHYDISTSGWPSRSTLEREVHAALARPFATVPSAAQASRELAGSPPALAGLHRQASQLLGGGSSLSARLQALRGYPVVLNVWASWCTPCQKEFPLFAGASAQYGRRVAFLGADYEDSQGEARSFLAGHPVSYPSYEAASAQLSEIATVTGMPTTIFINRHGRVAHVHIGQYNSQGTLDQEIESYAP